MAASWANSSGMFLRGHTKSWKTSGILEQLGTVPSIHTGLENNTSRDAAIPKGKGDAEKEGKFLLSIGAILRECSWGSVQGAGNLLEFLCSGNSPLHPHRSGKPPFQGLQIFQMGQEMQSKVKFLLPTWQLFGDVPEGLYRELGTFWNPCAAWIHTDVEKQLFQGYTHSKWN